MLSLVARRLSYVSGSKALRSDGLWWVGNLYSVVAAATCLL